MIITALFRDVGLDGLPTACCGTTVAVFRLARRHGPIGEAVVEIVGMEGEEGVHTIDLWFSSRRQCWVVERREPDGSVIGQSFCTTDEHDAAACLLEWLRTHEETHLVGRAARVAIEAAEHRLDDAA